MFGFLIISTKHIYQLQVQVHDLSKKMTKFVEANPSKRKDMPKRRRGRPPKAQSAKSSFTSNKIMKYEDLYGEISMRYLLVIFFFI